MFATGAAGNAEFATAMRKCFDNTDAVLATTSEGDCPDDPSDGPDDGARMSYLATTATSVLHTTTPTTTVRLLLDSGASNHITNNVTLAESFNFKKLRRPGKAFGGSVAGHQMTATLSGTTDWAPGTTYYVPDSTANLLALGEYQARGWEIKSNGRNELILTPPQPSATPLIFKRQRNNLYVWDVDISTVTMKPMEPQVLSPCSPPQPRATTVGAALKLVANRWLSTAHLVSQDRVEAIHWAHGHVSDNILGIALDHQVLKHGDDLSSHHVRLNRQVRGSCPGCDTGKFKELPTS